MIYVVKQLSRSFSMYQNRACLARQGSCCLTETADNMEITLTSSLNTYMSEYHAIYISTSEDVKAK